MSIVKIDAGILLEMFANGYRNLCRKEAQVNDLNVFPVPDGDTGSNMAKTLSGGVHAQMQEDDDVSASMKKFSKAVLLSARGNSGVILSQFIKGLSIASDGKSVMVPSDITPFLKQGVDSAYKAVANPVEGTMLTVLRETYEACEDTEEFAWLSENAADYGFILRYPKNKTDITKIMFEPWHYRYVGAEAAEEIMKKGITLEEYLGAVPAK